MSIFATDGVGSVLHRALNGITFRQNVIADNIANVDTPGFRASSVDFETQLRAAIDDGSFADGSAAGIAATTSPTDTPVGANDNNVDLRKETMAAMQTSYQQQVVGRAISDRHNLVITAASAR